MGVGGRGGVSDALRDAGAPDGERERASERERERERERETVGPAPHTLLNLSRVPRAS